jgi:nitroreductase
MEKRHSCRTFQKEEYGRDIIDQVLNLIKYAREHVPSAGNIKAHQTAIVVQAQAKVNIYMAALKQAWVMEAPMLVVFSTDLVPYRQKYLQQGDLYGAQDLAVFCTYVMLLLEDAGYNTCWIGAFDAGIVAQEIRIAKGMPIVPQAILCVGHET